MLVDVRRDMGLLASWPDWMQIVGPQLAVARITERDGTAKVTITCNAANRCRLKLTETIRVKQGKAMKLQIVSSKPVALANRQAKERVIRGGGIEDIRRPRTIAASAIRDRPGVRPNCVS
jgi:hypothetical protein